MEGLRMLLAAIPLALASAGCSRHVDSQDSDAATSDGSAYANGFAAAPTGVMVPRGYREWVLLAPSYRTDKNEIRAILGNSIAVEAAREKMLPFPDGAILAKLAWQASESPEFEGAIVPGIPQRIEFMVKDSRRWPQTGGWGFGRWVDGSPTDAATHSTCFPCHEARVPGRDFVFTRWAP